jgi:hypothetical protein
MLLVVWFVSLIPFWDFSSGFSESSRFRGNNKRRQNMSVV